MPQVTIESPKENWSKFPNGFLDNLDKFSPQATQAMCLIVRQTQYSRPNHRFSARYVALKTGMSRSAASRALGELTEKGATIRHGSGKGETGVYSIRWVSQKEEKVSLPWDSGVPPGGQEKDHPSKIKEKEETPSVRSTEVPGGTFSESPEEKETSRQVVPPTEPFSLEGKETDNETSKPASPEPQIPPEENSREGPAPLPTALDFFRAGRPLNLGPTYGDQMARYAA